MEKTYWGVLEAIRAIEDAEAEKRERDLRRDQEDCDD